MDRQAMFKQYKNMILKYAYFVSMKWNVPYDEMCSQGNEIFVKALNKFDGRASFSTYLYSKLISLNDYGEKQLRLLSGINFVEEFPDIFNNHSVFGVSYVDFEKRFVLFDSIATELSEDARVVIDYMLSNIDKKHSRHSVWMTLRDAYGWSLGKVKDIWQEIEAWWRSNQAEFSPYVY
jgi:hypothetical protein